MKTIKNTIAIFAATTLFASCGDQNSTTTEESAASTTESTLSGVYEIDTDNSQVMWEGTMLEVGGISLYGHHGTVAISEGSFSADNGALTGGTVVIDMTQINPKDENYSDQDGGRSSDLVGHLSSNDFFNVSEYPTSTFELIKGEGGKVEGHLTIRGNKKPVTIEKVEIMEHEGGAMHAKGNFTFDRQDFDVKFAMPVQEKILSDKIKMSFDIKGSKAQDA